MDMRSLVSLAESLKGANLRGYQTHEIEERLDALLASYRPLAFHETQHHVWYRGRVCPSGEGFSHLTDCIYPKAEYVKDFGRANYPTEPSYYAASNEATVVGELRAEPEQFVQIIISRLRQDATVPCHIVGDIEHIVHSGRSLLIPQMVEVVDKKLDGMSHEDALKLVFVDAFLADQFSRRVERPYEYKLSAAYAKKLAPGKGGIIYPSVEVRGGLNLAVPAQVFADNFEVLCTCVMKIKSFFGYAIYDFELTKWSCDFDESGKVAWDSKKALPFEYALGRGKVFSPDVSGWRVPK